MEQEEKAKQIFREKSLERVTSPEQLNSYIRVVNVGVWIILCAVIVLLIGALIWCAAIKLESRTVSAAAVVRNGELTLYVSEDSKADISEGMTVHVGETDLELPELDWSAVKLYSINDSAILDIIGETGERYAYRGVFCADLPNGIYAAKIVSAEISPFELIFN